MKGIQAMFDGDEGLLYVILPVSLSAPEPTPPLPAKAEDSSAVTSTRQEASSSIGKKEAPTKQEKVAAGEEEKGRTSGGKTAEDYKEDRSTVESGRKGSVVVSVINKRKLLILGVILGVMASLGLAVYLSYRLKGL